MDSIFLEFFLTRFYFFLHSCETRALVRASWATIFHPERVEKNSRAENSFSREKKNAFKKFERQIMGETFERIIAGIYRNEGMKEVKKKNETKLEED